MNPHMSSPSKGGAGTVEDAFQSSTFKLDMSIKVDAPVGAMSISPSSRDVVLASKQGLHIVDLDNPYDPPRFLQHLTAWSVADVQWSPHASHSHWVVSTSNQKAIVWNLALPSSKAIEHVLQSHTRAITDINFSAHDPNVLATCSVDSFVHCWDLRTARRPAMSFADWFAGATQVKYNRQNPHILASAHDRYVYIWDTRMGARPLKKINAHSTKIYGLDWNRTRPTGIITCALDKSVRFWDYEYAVGDTPERIINTSFPVWRARHTPFGWGVLTMPQRGDTSLYLWDRRRHKDATEEIPVHRFEGHTDNVKEFVWRWRGGERDDVDDREFQLVTWGLDKDIRLWDVDKELMAKIGHDTSKKIRFRITRKGAKYISYRNEEKLAKMAEQEQKMKDHSKMPPPKLTLTVDGARIRKDGLFAGQKGAIGHQLSQANTNGNGKNDDDRRFERLLSNAREGGFMRVGRRKRIDINPITWMKGVKMVRKLPDAEPAIPEGGGDGKIATRSSNFTLSWDAPENLGDEVSYVGSKFRYITFEKVNIAARTCTVSLFGPWGANENRIFVRTEISFPSDYPVDGQSIPEFKIEKTSNISDENIDKIDEELNKIASSLVAKRRVCLEACLCYLLGERHDNPHSDEDPDSSDDEEIVNTMAIGDEEEGLNSLINSSKQASVPLPKTCGAVWAPNGQLVCFFPPKEDRLGSKNVLSSLRETERGFRNGGRLWEGFGRLFMPSPTKEYDGDHDDSDSSFSSDEDSDDETDVRNIGTLRPGFGWGRIAGNSSIARGLRRNGSTDRSTQRSTGTGVRTTTTVTVKKRSVVSLHDMAHVLPSKFELARDYQIGEGSAVCEFNAAVCEKYGYRDLADVWKLLELILRDDVPLEVYETGKKLGTGTDSWEDPILVMARRASLEVGRRDSGLELDFDDEDEFFGGKDKLKGRVQWGGHPLGGSWFVEKLFEYFEKQSDVQMLAMLSCVLSETDKPRKSDLLIGSHTHLQGIDIPPFKRSAHPYYPTAEHALASQTSNFSISPSHTVPLPMPAANSYSSSLGAHFAPIGGSDPILPYSTGTTPPTHLRADDWTIPPHQLLSMSASPEAHHLRRRGFGGLASNLSNLGDTHRGFGSGAPRNQRPSPVDSLLNFSTGVTWGAITTFGSGSKLSSSSSSSSSSDLDEPITISMFNTHLLDEAEPLPLLNNNARNYSAYRSLYSDLLFYWGLPYRRSEVLKFHSLSPPHQQNAAGPLLSSTTGMGIGMGIGMSIGMGMGIPPSSPILAAVKNQQESEGLEIGGFCNKCNGILDVTLGARGECKVCKRRQITMNCGVCETVVRGLYGLCGKCGHVAHAACHRAWFHGGVAAGNMQTDTEERDAVDQRVQGEITCFTGCGCNCLGEDFVEENMELLDRDMERVAERNEMEGWGAYEGEYLW